MAMDKIASTKSETIELEEPEELQVEISKEPARVQSIGRAFSIMEVIADNAEGIALAKISKAVGLHNSTAFSLVRTMLELGYVRQDPENKRYYIGYKLFGLAAGANNESNLVCVAGPILQELARASKETCHIAISVGDEVIAIAKAEGASTIRMTERLGAVRPKYCTAIGKVLLATLEPGQFDEYLARTEMRRYTANTIIEPVHLRQEMETIRRAGLAIDEAEYNPEARCMAAPVYDFIGRTTAVIGISGPVWRVTKENTQRLGQIVLEHAAKLSAELGYRPQAMEPEPKAAVQGSGRR